MQDTKTGELKQLTEQQYESYRKMSNGAKQKRPLFRVGDIVEVNGGKFRIRKITKKDLILRGIRS